jgi:hypothetical protein
VAAVIGWPVISLTQVVPFSIADDRLKGCVT